MSQNLVIIWVNSNEIAPEDGNFIQTGVFSGPKNKATVTDKSKTDITVKGITLSKIASLIINYESILRITTLDIKKRLKVPQMKFVRDKKDWSVLVKVFEKEYGNVYTKRVLKKPFVDGVVNDFITIPYGYIN